MIKALRWGWLAGALALSSCTAGGGDFVPLAADPGKGVLYVYTLDNDMLAQSPQIVVDGNQVGKVKPLGHLVVEVKPGHHEVATTAFTLFKQKPVAIDISAGESLFLRYDSFRGSLLTPMPADIAQEEIRATRASTS
jgi:hypothetical protein